VGNLVLNSAQKGCFARTGFAGKEERRIGVGNKVVSDLLLFVFEVEICICWSKFL